MKKIIENFWLIFGTMLLVSIVDLIALPVIAFGAGFVLTFLFFCVGIYFKGKQ